MRIRNTLRTTPARVGLAALAAAAALGLAACGGGDEEPAATTEATTEAPATEAPATEATETGAAETGAMEETTAVTDYVAFTGATPGKADPSLSPIKIGWINTQGGQLDYPAATAGAEAAVKYVNDALGGIDGHPLELVTCFTASAEEEGQKCGQQFVNDDGISVIASGATVIGNESFYSTLKGSKPVIMGVGVLPVDGAAENAYALNGDSNHIWAPLGVYARDVVGATSAAVVYPSQAGAVTGAEAIKAGLETAGIEVKAVGFDPNAPDVLGALTAAGAQDAGVLVPVGDTPACINIAKAVEQGGLDTTVVASPLCLAADVASALGGDIPQWTFGIVQSIPTDLSAPDVQVYQETSQQYGLSEAQASDVFAALAWSEILAIARFMNAVGADNITPEAMSAEAKAFTGPVIMGPPTIQCGFDPAAPAVCNSATKFYNYKGAGKWEAASDWIEAPSS